MHLLGCKLAVVIVASAAIAGGCHTRDINDLVYGDVPANGMFVFRGPVLDPIAFVGDDDEDSGELAHRVFTYGEGEQALYVVDARRFGPDSRVDVRVVCDGCDGGDSVFEAYLRPTSDSEAPLVDSGAFTTSAFGFRSEQYDLVVDSYGVAITGPLTVDDSPLLLRFRGDGVDWLAEARAIDELGITRARFDVRGPYDGPLCGALTLLDVASNATPLGNRCVVFDPDTATAWGASPL